MRAISSGMIFTGKREINPTSKAYIGGRFCNCDECRNRYLERHHTEFSRIQRLDWRSKGE